MWRQGCGCGRRSFHPGLSGSHRRPCASHTPCGCPAQPGCCRRAHEGRRGSAASLCDAAGTATPRSERATTSPVPVAWEPVLRGDWRPIPPPSGHQNVPGRPLCPLGSTCWIFAGGPPPATRLAVPLPRSARDVRPGPAIPGGGGHCTGHVFQAGGKTFPRRREPGAPCNLGRTSIAVRAVKPRCSW